MQMTKAQQHAVYQHYSRRALHALMVMAGQRFDQILTRGDDRAFQDGGGFDQYGDATMQLPTEAALLEAVDELADGVFYMAKVLWDREGRPVVW